MCILVVTEVIVPLDLVKHEMFDAFLPRCCVFSKNICWVLSGSSHTVPLSFSFSRRWISTSSARRLADWDTGEGSMESGMSANKNGDVDGLIFRVSESAGVWKKINQMKQW